MTTISAGRIHHLVLAWFFLSGMAGLIYEVLWVRQLGLVFGTTLYAVSTVLAVFMLGLALGSLLFGRLTDRVGKPLRLYAILEGGLGLYVLAVPLLFKGLTALQASLLQQAPEGFFGLSLIRIILSFLVLIVPTTLMGGTLPVIAKLLVRREGELGSGVGHLYFINTLGAALGSSLAGFLLIPLIGVLAATYLAAAVNLAIGAGAFLLQRHMGREVMIQVVEVNTTPPLKKGPEESTGRRGIREAAPYSRALRIAVLAGFSLSGLASLSLEVSWTRVLTLVLGSSVYAFSLMLTAFLLGIALGSSVAARFIDRRRKLWLDFVLVEALIGISIIVLNPLLGQLPLFFVSVFSGLQESFWGLQTVQFFLIFLLMLIPTTLMGAAFPIAARIYTQDMKRLGRFVGGLYSGNTLGAVIGPLLTGFVIIPLVGIQMSISLVASIYLAIAGAVFIVGPLRHLTGKILAAGTLAAVAIGGFLLPAWDKEVLTSGVFLYAKDYLGDTGGSPSDRMRGYSLLFYKEGLQATVSVSEEISGNRLLRIDGKTDASSHGDLDTELLLGHLPMLLHPEPKRVLVVGLGSGITLGAVEQHSSLEKVESVEIEPAVVEAASYFSEANHKALDHPKLRMVVADARNYVLASQEQYDVITAEPSNPWMSGSSLLFTREQFELYRQRLAGGGIVVQWLHFYNMSPQDLKTALNTFRAVFPHATLWGTGSDLLLVGSQRELRIDLQALRARWRQEDKVRADLERVSIEDPYDLLAHFLMDERSLSSYSAPASLHTDNRPILEFSAPINLYRATLQANLESMKPYAGSVLPLLTNVADPEAESKIGSYIDSREHLHRAMVLQEGGNIEGARAEYEKALSANPRSRLVRRIVGGFYGDQGKNLMRQGDLEKASANLERAIELDPSHAPSHIFLGNLYLARKEYQKAVAAYGKALELRAGNVFLYYSRGSAYHKLGREDEAIADYTAAIEHDPHHAAAYADRGLSYLEKGNIEQAIADLDKSLELEPKHIRAYSDRGLAYLSRGDFDRSIADFTKAIQLDPGLALAYVNRGSAYLYREEYDKAIADYSKAIGLSPTLTSAYINLGAAYVLKQDYAGAVKEFTRAIELEPDNANAYFNRGRAYKLLGKKEEAIADLQQCIALAADSDLAEQARASIAELKGG